MASETNNSKTTKKEGIDWDGVTDWGIKVGLFALQATIGGLCAAAGAGAYNRIAKSDASSAGSNENASGVIHMKKSASV